MSDLWPDGWGRLMPSVPPSEPTAVSPGQPLLTDDEHRAVAMAGELWNLLCVIVGDGPSRAGDLGELVAHIHGIQQAVLKQAAARAYPDRYRLLGGMVGDGGEPSSPVAECICPRIDVGHPWRLETMPGRRDPNCPSHGKAAKR